jgi:hypothetical protein
MKKHLLLANQKKLKHNYVSETEMKLEMDEFIPFLYHRCSPNVYGMVFSKRVIIESSGLLKETPHYIDNGDFYFFNTRLLKNVYGEIKISYKGMNGNYRITNIRDHQNFQYFVLCFVDTDNNFTPSYYVVKKEDITTKGFFTLTAMNGPEMANRNNMVVPKSTTINGADCEWYFTNHNVMKGNTFSDLKLFLSTIFSTL